MNLAEFFESEEAQATVEYMLLLTVAVFLFMIVYKTLLKPLFAKLGEMAERLMTNFFNGDKMHYFPMGK